ncbi:MAG: type II toxin-antitoxin system PemK/MazF family toxin [Pyrinomonadaceae bacterium]|nr:type II toxin-antitoxin system PemK/MazF family toxin [Pyrinomonadaceae bacterium]
MNAGEIFWVEFPARGGRAQAGRRPAIVVQKDKTLPTVLLIPLTTQQDALRFAGMILIEPEATNTLRQPSIALVFQLTAVDKNFVKSKLGTISDDKMNEIWALLMN